MARLPTASDPAKIVYPAAMHATLTYPFPKYPGPGEVIEVAPGVLWLRLRLPFALNHLNVYLIEDDGGWFVLDTGLDTKDCKAGWDAVLDGPLKGEIGRAHV